MAPSLSFAIEKPSAINVYDHAAFEAECTLALERAKRAHDCLVDLFDGDVGLSVTGGIGGDGEPSVAKGAAALTEGVSLAANLRRAMQFLVSLRVTPTLNSENALATVHKLSADAERLVAEHRPCGLVILDDLAFHA